MIDRQQVLEELINGNPRTTAITALAAKLDDLSRRYRAIEEYQKRPEPFPYACGCVGRRPGEPRCPCAMRNVVNVDGRWYEVATIKIVRGTRLVAGQI